MDGGPDGGGAAVQGVPAAHRHGGAGKASGGGAENALGGIAGQGTQGKAGGGFSFQQPWGADFSLLNGTDLGGVNVPGYHFQKPFLGGADPVAQGGETVGLRVIPGDGTNA